MATIDEVASIELSLEQKVSPSEPATLTVQSDGESGKSWIRLNFYTHPRFFRGRFGGSIDRCCFLTSIQLSYQEACWLRDRLKYLTEDP